MHNENWAIKWYIDENRIELTNFLIGAHWVWVWMLAVAAQINFFLHFKVGGRKLRFWVMSLFTFIYFIEVCTITTSQKVGKNQGYITYFWIFMGGKKDNSWIVEFISVSSLFFNCEINLFNKNYYVVRNARFAHHK